MSAKIVSLREAKEEILQIWNSEKDGECNRLDIEEEIKKIDNECYEDTNNCLGPWIAMLDEALHFMTWLYKYCWNIQKDNDKNYVTSAFVMLLARTCSHIIAIRKLIIGGLEECARSVSRSLIETIDLMIVSLIDEQFSKLYFSEDMDEKKFWEKNVAYGKIYKKIDYILDLAGIDATERENFIQHRKEAKKILSSAVHSAHSSAFRSMFIPSLKYYGKLSTSLFGHVSLYSPEHLRLIITEIYLFGSIFMKLLTSDQLHILVEDIKGTEFKSFTASFFVLQELVTEYYEKYLSMDFDFPEEE